MALRLIVLPYPPPIPPGASMPATTWEILAAKGGTVGENVPVILPKWRLPRHLGIFYMPQIYDMGPATLLPSEGRRAEDFFTLKNPDDFGRVWTRELG